MRPPSVPEWGVSDLASGWGYEETRTNQGSRIIYFTENPVRQHHLSMLRARLWDYWLRLACWGWPAGIISTCFFYLSKVSRLPTKTKSEAFCYAPDTYNGLGNVFSLFSVTFKLDLIRLFSISNQRSSWISCKCPPYWFCKGRKYLRNGCNFKFWISANATNLLLT